MNEIERLSNRTEFILSHPTLVYVLLSISLFLELFAFVIVLNKRIAFIYGFILFGMHLGIQYVMNIYIKDIVNCMIVFTLNPIFILCTFGIFLFEKIKRTSNRISEHS